MPIVSAWAPAATNRDRYRQRTSRSLKDRGRDPSALQRSGLDAARRALRSTSAPALATQWGPPDHPLKPLNRHPKRVAIARAPARTLLKWHEARAGRISHVRRRIHGRCRPHSQRKVTSIADSPAKGSTSHSAEPIQCPGTRPSMRRGGSRKVMFRCSGAVIAKALCQSNPRRWLEASASNASSIEGSTRPREACRSPGHQCGQGAASVSIRHTACGSDCRRNRLMKTRCVAGMAQGRRPALVGVGPVSYAGRRLADAPSHRVAAAAPPQVSIRLCRVARRRRPRGRRAPHRGRSPGSGARYPLARAGTRPCATARHRGRDRLRS